MLADVNLQSVAGRIAQFHGTASKALSTSLMRLGSGRQVQAPRDNTGYFFRSQRIDRDNASSRVAIQELTGVLGTLSVADELGTTIHTDLTRMKELAMLYWSSSATFEEKIAWGAEFDALAIKTTRSVQSAVYDGRQLMSDSSANPLRTARINPADPSTIIEISYGAQDVVDTSGLTITGPDRESVLAGIEAQYARASSFLGKTSAYTFGVSAQIALARTAMSSTSEFQGKIRDTDDAAEMSRMVDSSIRKQMSLAMLSQANMYRSGVLALVTTN